MTDIAKRAIKKQAEKIELLERQLHYCRKVSKMTEDECARIIEKQNKQITSMKAEIKQFKAAIKSWKKEEKLWHKMQPVTRVFELTAYNMVGAGGPMGRQETPEIFREIYGDIGDAEKRAKAYHKEHDGDPAEVVFRREGSSKTYWTSGDLSWVMYDINEIRIK